MKRMHIHISVNDLDKSIDFYSTLFAAPPSVVREDYAKWDLSDPAIALAISNRGHISGINHLGIKVDSDNELTEIAQRLELAEITFSKQTGTSCCYANSNKHWVLDPQGIAWESFHSLNQISVFGEDSNITSDDDSSACCIPLHLNQSSNEESAACCVPNVESKQ